MRLFGTQPQVKGSQQQALQRCIYHEINNPLAAVMATVEMVQMNHRSLNHESIDLYMSRLMKGILRIQSLLDLTLSDMRDPQVDWEELSVADVLDNMQQLFADQMRSLDLDYQVVHLEASAPYVRGSMHLVEEILINLLKNAIEASDPGMSIRLMANQSADGVTFTVEDEGPGIDEAVADRIFEPFVTTKNYGSGFGLYYSRFLADQMGASVTLSHRVPHGTSAAIRFSQRDEMVDKQPSPA